MSYTYVVKKFKVYRGGNEMLRVRLELPQLDGCDRINEFYLRLAEGCESYCREVLAKRLLIAKNSYELICRVAHLEDAVCSVLMRVRLICGAELKGEYIGAVTWSTEEQCMLPPRLLVKRYRCRSKCKRRDMDGLFLSKGELQQLKNADIEAYY